MNKWTDGKSLLQDSIPYRGRCPKRKKKEKKKEDEKLHEKRYTDEAVIEDEEGLKSVDRLVQSKWLIQTSHMGYRFTP